MASTVKARNAATLTKNRIVLSSLSKDSIPPEYDIYTCTRCDETYEDHSGNGAPADYGDTSISKIIVSLFAKLGTFAGKVVSWVINLFDKALGSLDTLITRFSELTGQITSVGGDYPAWLSGFWAVLPEELQLVLTFAFICIFVGVVGRKLFFV